MCGFQAGRSEWHCWRTWGCHPEEHKSQGRFRGRLTAGRTSPFLNQNGCPAEPASCPPRSHIPAEVSLKRLQPARLTCAAVAGARSSTCWWSSGLGVPFMVSFLPASWQRVAGGRKPWPLQFWSRQPPPAPSLHGRLQQDSGTAGTLSRAESVTLASCSSGCQPWRLFHGPRLVQWARQGSESPATPHLQKNVFLQHFSWGWKASR